MSNVIHAYRGAILHSLADPAEVGIEASYAYFEDGALQSLTDNYRGSSTVYDYDVDGNRTLDRFTENGVVYLLGLVTRAEGAAATSVVSSVSGVQKIVTLYQYTN